MQKLNSKLRIEILSTIDELNQYLNGNVTTEALSDALEDCQLALHYTAYYNITSPIFGENSIVHIFFITN